MLRRLIYTSKIYGRCIYNRSRNLSYTAIKGCWKSDYNFSIKINNTDVHEYIEKVRREYEELSQEGQNNQRLAELKPIVDILREREAIFSNLLSLKELLQDSDKDIKSLAEEEKQLCEERISLLDEELKEALLPSTEADLYKAVVLEVNAGVGGQEAMLFANELFEMYCNFVKFKGWNSEIADYQPTELGGIRHACVLISGDGAFRYFKHEAGVHRVQRIPTTEKAGRIHTSTVSVVALPQPEEIDVNINPQDLRIDTKRASGAGGQHVNTTDSAVRITHIPTGISVECQVDRSQHKNRRIAMQKLKARLYEIQLETQIASIEATRKSQVRTNYRNEKIRTYNFSQDRITDHRLKSGNFHNIKVFLEGGKDLETLINKLDYTERMDLLMNAINNVKIN